MHGNIPLAIIILIHDDFGFYEFNFAQGSAKVAFEMPLYIISNSFHFSHLFEASLNNCK